MRAVKSGEICISLMPSAYVNTKIKPHVSLIYHEGRKFLPGVSKAYLWSCLDMWAVLWKLTTRVSSRCNNSSKFTTLQCEESWSYFNYTVFTCTIRLVWRTTGVLQLFQVPCSVARQVDTKDDCYRQIRQYLTFTISRAINWSATSILCHLGELIVTMPAWRFKMAAQTTTQMQVYLPITV